MEKSETGKTVPFWEDSKMAVFTCVHVLNKEEPILHVFHCEDGYWQFLCNEKHNTDDARIISLKEVYDIDNSIIKVLNIDIGKSAHRINSNSEWVIK